MRTIEISHRTIVFTVLFLIGLWVIWQIKQVLLLLLLAFLVATALKPLVDRLTRLKFPRPLAILVTYIAMVGIFAGVLISIITPLIDQTTALVRELPRYFAQFGFQGLNQDVIGNQLANLGEVPANVFRFVSSIFSNIINVIAVLVLAFYLLLEWGKLDRRLALLFGDSSARAKQFLDKLEIQLGAWVRGELALMLIIAVFTYIGLRILGINFALPLALLAGILEIVPNIGPIVAAVPAVIIGFTVSPIMGGAVAALYFLIQQLENSVIVPKVMERSVGLSPLIVLLAIGIGLELGGIMGAVLAVPAVLIIRVTYREFLGELKKG